VGIRLSMQVVFWVGWGEKQRVPKFLTCSPKSSRYYFTFIPYALADVLLLSPIYMGQTGRTLSFTVVAFYFGEPPMGFFFFGDGSI
jgi:hypothetical protein